MKFLALGLLALVVLASAKPTKKSVLSRQKRQQQPGGSSFDSSNFDMSNFDMSNFDMSNFDLGSIGLGNIDISNFDINNLDLGSFSSDMQSAIFDQVMGSMANDISIPDAMGDPDAFASLIESMEGQLDQFGEAGQLKMESMFSAQIDKGLTDLGITGFEDGDIDTSDFFDQMDTQSWETMSKLSSNKEMFNMNDMGSDDFFALMDMAGDADSSYLDSFMGMSDDSSSMTPEQMEQMPPEMFAALDADVLQTMAANFSQEQTNAMCGMMSDTDAVTAGELFYAVDCVDYYMSMGGGIDEEQEMAMLEAMVSKKSMDQWSDAEWDQAANFAGGFDPDYFEYMPADRMINNIGTFANQVGYMEEDDMFAFMDGIEEAFTDFSQITTESFSQMGPMIEFMDFDDFDMIPAATKFACLDSFASIELDDEFAAEMAEEVLDLMPPMDQWTSDEFGKSINFIMYDEDALDLVPIGSMIGALDKMGALDFDETEAITITERMMEDATFGDATNWNSSMLKDAGPLLAGLDPTFVVSLDSDVMYDAFINMNQSVKNSIKFPKATARVMLDKMITKVGIGSMQPKMFGSVVKSMKSDEIAGLSGNYVADSMGIFMEAYDDLDSSSARAVVDMAIAGPGGLNGVFDKLGPFFGELTMDEIDSLPYDTINPKSPPAALTLDATPAQTRRGWQNMVAKFGNPSKAAGNWTLKMWKFQGPVICGIPCSEINKIPLGNKFPSILDLFSKQEKRRGCLNDAQMGCMAKRLRQFYFNNGTDNLNYPRVTKSNLMKSAIYMASMNVSDLIRFNQSVCQHVLNNIGKFELDMIPRSGLINLKNYLMNCTGKEASGELITEKEMRSVGDLQCGLEVADIPKLAPKIFKNNVGKMLQRCQLPVEVEDALFERALQANNITIDSFNISESQLMKMGGGVFNLNQTMREKIPQNTLVKALGRVKKVSDKLADKAKKRAANGLSTDISDADLATRESRLQDFYTTASTAIIAKREASARKKRSTYSSLTCGDLRKMGSGVTGLTVAQLDVTDSCFSSCYETLGTQTGWSTEQKAQLATTAKRVWGSTVSSWSSSNLLNLGTIAQGLSDSDLGAITYTNDIASSFGKYAGWTSTQLSSIFGKWISDVRSNSAASITSADLQSLGDIVCGASTTQINAIPAASYKGAATKVGVVTVCSEAQLQSLAALAKNAAGFGSVSTWDASTVASVGTVIGGLTAAEIATLSSTQIEAISAATINSMPASAFAGFTSEQLGYMTTTQVRSITSAQAAALSPSAQATLTANENYVAPAVQSGAESVKFSLAILAIVSLRTIL